MPYELLPARFEPMGGGDIPPDSFMVTHRLKRIPYNKTQEYKDAIKTLPQNSTEFRSDVV